MGEGWRVQVCSPLLQGPPPLHYSAVNASNTLSITAPSEFLLSFYILLILRVEGAFSYNYCVLTTKARSQILVLGLPPLEKSCGIDQTKYFKMEQIILSEC